MLQLFWNRESLKFYQKLLKKIHMLIHIEVLIALQNYQEIGMLQIHTGQSEDTQH